MRIAGLCSGHDCAYAILENGIPILHNELERFTREKEPIGDSIQFLLETYGGDGITHFTHCLDTWHGGIQRRYPTSFQKLNSITQSNGGAYHVPGHHQSHAANAFFSSNFNHALIVTIDGGGQDYGTSGEIIRSAFTVWSGSGNHIQPISIISSHGVNIGTAWHRCLQDIFGLSAGHPIGNQAGSVMAMACLGDPHKHFDQFDKVGVRYNKIDYQHLKKIAENSEQDKFDVAAALQAATEACIKRILGGFIGENKYLCLAGGVALNSVLVGKLYAWYPQLEHIFVCPVPYDAGLAIGSAQYVWHHILDKPRITWKDNITPYLGRCYSKAETLEALRREDIVYKSNITDEDVVRLLADGEIISVFGGGSESGKRALGNRSILADPRDANMKNAINEKVKHRQWFRPFAPSIIREEVDRWFVRDVDSPYMSFVVPFREDVRHKVPAVVHFDGTGRLQTVTANDNPWFYNLLQLFYAKTGVPILLNTSFNDREPIVETPTHAIDCFLKTDIDKLYFHEFGILVSKNGQPPRG